MLYGIGTVIQNYHNSCSIFYFVDTLLHTSNNGLLNRFICFNFVTQKILSLHEFYTLKKSGVTPVDYLNTRICAPQKYVFYKFLTRATEQGGLPNMSAYISAGR